jgi:hypothetical protein
MKKSLIVLLALGALSFAPAAEAGSRRHCRKACPKEKCVKPETAFKQSCPRKCEEHTVLTSEKWVPTMVPGRQKVKCYTTYKTCSDVEECCKEVPCEIECIPFDQEKCMEEQE